MPHTFLLFDFDGVIVDTLHIGMDMNKRLDPNFNQEEYLKRFEGNIFESFQETEKHKSQDELEKQHDEFFAHYDSLILDQKPVGGMVEMLGRLAQSHRMVLVSSTTNAPIEKFLHFYNLSQYFDKIFGSDVHRSKMEKIKMIFHEYETTAERCLFITDTLGDIREAEKAGVRSLAVAWGFHPAETLQKGNPIAILNRPDQLFDAVQKYFVQIL